MAVWQRMRSPRLNVDKERLASWAAAMPDDKKVHRRNRQNTATIFFCIIVFSRQLMLGTGSCRRRRPKAAQSSGRLNAELARKRRTGDGITGSLGRMETDLLQTRWVGRRALFRRDDP